MKEHEIKEVIQDIFRLMMIEAEVTISLDADGVTWWVDVQTPAGYSFTAHNGEGLLALNYVVKEMFRHKTVPAIEHHIPLIIDINGFQKKHIDMVKTIAHMMAERARFFKSSVALDPMSPYDRRIVHEHLGTATDIKTESEGVGRDRHVMIKYVG
jgi:spoIIIJ-associated protein